MWRSHDRYEDKTKLEPTQCPVCKTLLGKRDCKTIFMAHCQECKATFYWKPWATVPTAVMDRDIPERCGCNGCGR